MDYSPLDRPEDIPKTFVEAWNRRDADGIADLFDEDAEFVNVVGIWWHDREAIRKAHAYGLERIFNNSTLRLGTVKVKYLADDIAVVHARMSLSGQTHIEDSSSACSALKCSRPSPAFDRGEAPRADSLTTCFTPTSSAARITPICRSPNPG